MEVFEKDYYNFVKEVKGKIIEAIYEDDELAEILTLKGGTLLDMFWGISGRPSKDIDFSIDRN
jgi:predicted nucleotidyltransferase component of viral defense system